VLFFQSPQYLEVNTGSRHGFFNDIQAARTQVGQKKSINHCFVHRR